MRRLFIMAITAVCLPTLAASAVAAEFKLDPSSGIDLALPGFSGKNSLRPVQRGPRSRCYFIGQLNRNLQKPNSAPQMVPLADPDAASAAGDVNCLTTSLQPLTASR